MSTEIILSSSAAESTTTSSKIFKTRSRRRGASCIYVFMSVFGTMSRRLEMVVGTGWSFAIETST